MASQQLKRMIPQLLLSVSLFSFVFSYSSSSVYSPKFHYYFSGNSLQLLSHALNKNCLFLICNGLLVFLAKTSGFIRPPSGHDLNDVRIADSLQTALEKYVLEEVATHETKKEDENEEEEEVKGKCEESPKEVSIFIAESEEEGGVCELEDEEKDEYQADSRRFWLFNDDDEQPLYGEEELEEDEEEMSTEELNKKFEDFIRRMKEDIIINEARQEVAIVE